MKLRGSVINAQELVSLPNLRTLRLMWVVFPGGDNAISKIFRGCTSLEDLLFGDCLLEELQVLDLSITSLSRLTLIYSDVYKILIDSPNLEYLRIGTNDTCLYVLKNLKPLDRAKVYVESMRSFSPIIDGLYSVKFLDLTAQSFKVTIIKFKTPCHDMQSLCLWCETDKDDPCGIVSDLFEIKPFCLAQKSRKVEIVDFSGSELQFTVVDYLLQHGVLQELMSFRSSDSKESTQDWPLSRLRSLVTFPRCSKTWQD